jgi:hypothetical protein
VSGAPVLSGIFAISTLPRIAGVTTVSLTISNWPKRLVGVFLVTDLSAHDDQAEPVPPSKAETYMRWVGTSAWCPTSRHAARFDPHINTDEVFGTHRRRPRRRSVAHGRAMSNGCTFAPPAIRGFDGSKCSRSSRFLTSARATTKASFRLLAWRSAMLKKASPK